MNTKFNILRFSPDPEEVEYVNVAIWIEPRRVVYDPEFPKLRCVAPGYDTSILKFYLDDLHETMDSPVESLMSKSSQFIVTKAKSLHAEPSEAAIRDLQRKYLNRHHVTGKTRHDADQHVESKLHDLLVGLHVPPEQMMKRADPSRFLSQRVRDLKHVDDFHIARVISGRNKLILVDGINLHLRNREHVEKRATDIACSYYNIGGMREVIRSVENRELRRAVVVFGSDQVKDDSKFQYLIASVQRESEYLITPERLDQAFVNDVFDAAKPFF